MILKNVTVMLPMSGNVPVSVFPGSSDLTRHPRFPKEVTVVQVCRVVEWLGT